LANPDGIVSGLPDAKPFVVLTDMNDEWQRYSEGAAGVLRGVIEAQFYLPAARASVDCPTRTRSGTITSLSAVVTGLALTSDLRIGQEVQGTGIPLGSGNVPPTVIKSIDSISQVTLTSAATANGTPSLDFLGMVYTAASSEALIAALIPQLMAQSTALVWRGALDHSMASEISAGERTQEETIHRTITLTAPYGLNA
jgi:hypothetical protein